MNTISRGLAYALVTAAVAIAPAVMRAQQTLAAGGRAGAAAASAGNPANGRKAFIAHSCYSCHGYWAEGGVGVRLVGYPDTLDSFITYVRQPKGVMPPAGAKITAQEFADIYAWLRSIPPSPDAKTIDLLKP